MSLRKSEKDRVFVLVAIAAVIFFITPVKERNRILQNIKNSFNGVVVQIK